MEPVAIRNRILLRGKLKNPPEFSHENHGRTFCRFYVEVPRLSGAIDILPVVAEEHMLSSIALSCGEMLLISGQVRSHNIRDVNKRHLLIFVFASTITVEDGDPINQVTLDALVCRDPTYRRTPLGREICDVMLAVPRFFRRADYIPCILWGKIAAEAANCNIGDQIILNGRLQSRIYTKLTDSGTEERTAYEISALTAEFPLPPTGDFS